MPAGAGREEAAAALRSEGFRCRGAREPYEGTARFVERPTDLVVLSLERFRARDVGFVTTVRRRAPDTRVLLLVPEGRRQLAVKALEAGADAYVLVPFFAAELKAVARRLIHRPKAEETNDTGALARLATEVSHAVNNPLQILSLMGEAENDAQRREELTAEIARVRDVVDILGRYGHRTAPAKDRGLLGPLLTRCMERFATQSLARPEGQPPVDGPAFAFDAEQVQLALDDLVGLIVHRAPQHPVPLAARIRQRGPDQGRAVEAAVRGRGVHLDPETLAAMRTAVIWSHDETRAPHSGLALAEAVARDHGATVTTRETTGGTVLALQFPLEDPRQAQAHAQAH